MALSFSVFNKFRALDGVTAPVGRMNKAVGKFGNRTQAAFRKADRSASKFGGTLKALFVGGGIIAGIALLRQGIGKVTNQFIQFDDAIFAAGARFSDIGPDVENFTESIKGIQKAAREAGATTEFTATQAAQALDFMARAGWSSAEAIGGLNSMINLSTASGEEFARVADISTDLLGAFGMNADTTAGKIKNLNRLNDVLVKTVNSANVTVEDMFDTMKTVGPVAAGILGASLEEVAALTGVLGSSGIKGTLAMTALKNAYLRLAAPASDARKILKALNITMDDGKGGARKITDIIEELGKKTEHLGKIEQAQIFDALFGKRAIAGSKNIALNIKNIKEFEKALFNSAGTSKRTAEVMRLSLGNRLKALNSAMVEFGFKILDNFKIRGKDAITGLTEAIRDLDVKPLIRLLELMVGMAKTTHQIFTANKDLIPVVLKLVGIFAGLKTVMIGLNAVASLSAFLLASPFVVATTAIVAWGLAIKSVKDNWKFIVMDIKILAKNIKDVFIELFDWLERKFKKILDIPKNTIKFFTGDEDQPRAIVEKRGINPISPNAAFLNTMRQETENRQTVDVNLNNVPQGSTVKQPNKIPGFKLTMGFSGDAN